MSEAKPPRRAAVIDLLAGFSRALHTSEIATRLGVEPKHLAALSRVIDDLVFDGTIVPLAGHRFRIAKLEATKSRGEAIEGFLSVNPRGFGFVQREGDADDVFVPAESMLGALHGDRVAVRVVARSSRGSEGAVVEILSRRSARVSGTLRRRGRSAWIEPDDSRLRGPIVIDASDEQGRDGDVVLADITTFPERPDENPAGKIAEVLGRPGEPDVEVRKILGVAGVVEPHPPGAVDAARAFGLEVAPEALEGREDLTHLPLPTIDPEDARDHDDAIWAVRNPDGSYRAWVAIADVSSYVLASTPLDASACDRGCSIYLPDRAIPMLPRELSSNLCSLLPDVVRLCLAVEIDLDAGGVVQKSRIFEGFMRSRAKLTYEMVARTLNLSGTPPTSEPKNPAVQAQADAMKVELAVLRDLSGLLRAQRMRRGALDFDLPEAKIVVDPETKMPLAAQKRAKDPGVAKAYQIVEELMLLANEIVAQYLTEKNIPGVYRNHAPPDPERIARFASICQKLGVDIDLEELGEPKTFSAFVKKLKSHPSHAILDSLLVRSLKQAVYDVANIGHFGLASKAYAHFTSPIRRYPDLVVHRAIRVSLRGQKIDRSDAGLEQMRAAAQLASERERRAMQVERDVVDLYGAILMKEKIGEAFAGVVTGIVGSGVFVTLDDPFVSVLVRNESLGQDSYEADDDGFALVGSRSGDRITLGDAMMVQIEDISLERRTTYARRVVLGASGEEAPRAEDGRGRPFRGARPHAAKEPKPARRDKSGKKAARAQGKAVARSVAPKSAKGGKKTSAAKGGAAKAAGKAAKKAKPGKKGKKR